MDQNDFRNLINSNSGPSTSTTKRSRDDAFSSKRSDLRKSASLAPRRIKHSNPFKQSNAAAVESSAIIKTTRPPKSLLPDGYTDRVKTRSIDPVEHEKEQQVQALKDFLARKKISHQTYLQKMQDLSTGDVTRSGMVRGLDRKLLERVRAGEDVFETPSSQMDTEAAIEALEQVLLEKTNTSNEDEPRNARSSGTPNSRDALLASLKKVTQSPDPSTALGTKFTPIVQRNSDGTTTETFEEAGQKVKVVRDSRGQIVKKLVKKMKANNISLVKPTAEESAVLETVTEKHKTTQVEQKEDTEQDNLDIFEDAGTDYDPFSSLGSIPSRPSFNAAGPARNYFESVTSHAAVEEPDPLLPTSTEEFLRQNRDALTRASSIVDRQTKVDLEKLAARNAKDAGFGLVFRDADAYAADLREVPEDDEMFEKKRRGKNQSKDTDS